MMEVRFLTGRDGRNIKRENSRRACSPCRQKKKRCFHNRTQSLEEVTQAGPHNLHEEQPASSTISPQHEAEKRQPFYSTPRSPSAAGSNGGHDHFVCNTNPVVTLLDDPESRAPKSQPQRGDLGAPLRRNTYLPSQSETTGGSPAGLVSHINDYVLPPKSNQEVLLDIYFRRIHPLLPLLDEDETRSQFANRTLSLPLLQSICLVASKDRRAAPALCLGSDTTVLPLERFTAPIYADIMKNMPKKEEKRILTMQILALLSLHGWDPTGCEDSSLNLLQAVHHCHTLGLHLSKPGKLSESSRRLFWCIWSLDRWNAAINGRPLLVHDYDMDQVVNDVLSRFQPPFRIWLRLADQLGQVIGSFRPVMDASREQYVELPIFEEIVEDSDGWATSTEILKSLELFHYAVVILSTHSQGLQGRSRSRMTQIRQSQSILSIAALVRKDQMRDPLPVPISAYTVSLAFSVAYSQFKETKLLSARLLAVENLELFHQCMRALGDIWLLAAVMTRLSKNALDGIHRQLAQEHPDTWESRADHAGEEQRNQASSVYHIADAHTAPLTDSGDLQSLEAHSNIGIHNHNISAPEPSFEFPPFIEEFIGSSDDEAYFDSFLENFPALNFPCALGEPFLVDQNLPT